MMKSIWQGTPLPAFSSLKGDKKTDILVIGGGITGLLCAHYLQQAGMDYMLIEADRLCGGVTEGTTAKITAQHGLIYHKLLKARGKEGAGAYLMAARQALAEYRRLCPRLDCDFLETDSYLYAMERTAPLERELEALAVLGYSAEYVADLPLPLPIEGAIKFSRQAQFHPQKFAAAISKGLHIFEHTPALSYEGGQVLTPGGRITPKKIIVATHFPLWNKHGSYFLKLYQDRSYVLALENGPDLGGMYRDIDSTGLSFRNWGSYLLLGGGGHRTGKPSTGWAELEGFARRHYPHCSPAYRWATQDCMSLDSVPYIGQYSANTPDVFVATGFNKWGMTSAMTSALLLTDLVQEKENPFAEFFSPSRSVLHRQLAVNGAEAIKSLIWPSKRRCPHLGCALKWNPQERSWDCPCHGSRFSEKGALLDNPASGDLKKA